MLSMTSSAVLEVREHRDRFTPIEFGKLFYSTISNEMHHPRVVGDKDGSFRYDWGQL